MRDWLRVILKRVLPYALQRRSGDRVAVGNRGEALAAAHFRAIGWKVLGRNVAVAGGEIDLVCESSDGTIAIVEVKTVSRRKGGSVDAVWAPERRVDASKRKQLRKLAAALCAVRGWPKVCVRFDVVAVELFDDGTHDLRHRAGAFGFRR